MGKSKAKAKAKRKGQKQGKREADKQNKLTNCPRAVVHFDGSEKVAVDDWRLTFETSLEVLLLENKAKRRERTKVDAFGSGLKRAAEVNDSRLLGTSAHIP